MLQKNVEDIYPLSPMQEGVFYHSLLAPGDGVYLLQYVTTLEGLDVAAFLAAWRRLLERHPILRTAFVWKGLERPLQVVGREVGLPVLRGDWSRLSPEEQRRAFDRYLVQDRSRGFLLSRAPLLRLALFDLGQGRHGFVLSYHHLLLDGWSKQIVVDELFTLYQAYRRGEEPPLPQPRPYHDYIAWLARCDLAQAEAFWRRTLAGFTAPTPLGDQPAPAGAADGGPNLDPLRDHLPAELTAALEETVRRSKLTVNTLVQAAWALLLAERSGHLDVVFGTTVSGRPAELQGVESMIGVFINTLPVRVDVAPEAPLLEWLWRLQETLAEIRTHEHSPLVEVQGWSEVPRGQPLFESLVVFENYPADRRSRRQADGGSERPMVRTVFTGNYPLTLIVAPGERMPVELMFDPCRFGEGERVAILERFKGLVEAIGQRLGAGGGPVGSLLSHPLTSVPADVPPRSLDEEERFSFALPGGAP